MFEKKTAPESKKAQALILKELLESVEAGNVDGFALVVAHVSGTFRFQISPGKVSELTMLGGLDILKQQLVSQVVKAGKEAK